jgi:hypothetical protein
MNGPLNSINDVCDSVEAAIKSLVGPTVDVHEARHPSLTFALNLRGQGIVWSYGRYQKVGEGPLGDRGRQDFVWPFTIAIVGMSWSSPAGANREARMMAETLRGSPSDALIIDQSLRPPNLRTIQLGKIGPDPIYLAYQGETVELDPNFTPQAGRVAYIQQWATGPQVRV